MKLLYLNQSRDRVPAKWLERWVKALGRLLKIRGRELVIVFVNSREMRRMNKQYRGKDYATDVLSFHPVEKTSVGELVLCLPVIRAQSKRTGLSERGELGYMIVHGVLHLMGHDHVTKSDEAEMFALQDELYARLEKSVGLR